MKIKKIELAEIFISDIRTIILSARESAIRSVDTVRVQMYWKLGERIFIEEQKGQDRAEYGAYLLQNVALEIEKPVQGMIFAISFVRLRQTTGGFHADSFHGCLFGSVLTFLLAIEYIAPLVGCYVEAMAILLFLSVVCILYFSPVNHPNLGLSQEERKRHKYLCLIVLRAELGIIGFGEYLKLYFQRYMVAAVILCAVYILLAKIISQEVKG